MKEFDIDLIDKLKELIEAKDSAQVLAEIKDLHPADIAELVSELDDTDDSLFLLQLLDNETMCLWNSTRTSVPTCWSRCLTRPSPRPLRRWTPTMPSTSSRSLTRTTRRM